MTTESKINVGNGGAGIVGFVQFMFNKFNEVKGTNYNFEWVKSDTADTLVGLADSSLDMGWPYEIERVCEDYAKHAAMWTEPKYIFRDHFLLAGPISNPAGLAESSDPHPHLSNDEVYAMFKAISEGKNGTVFLTRNDDSGTNVMERNIFKKVLGRYPDVNTDSWYVAITGDSHYPDAALKESNEKGYYTLSDRGIWTFVDDKNESNLKIFCEGGDSYPDDIMLNVCLALTPKNAAEGALEYYDWLSGEGQQYIEEYKINGQRLYSKAPENATFPCRTTT